MIYNKKIIALLLTVVLSVCALSIGTAVKDKPEHIEKSSLNTVSNYNSSSLLDFKKPDKQTKKNKKEEEKNTETTKEAVTEGNTTARQKTDKNSTTPDRQEKSTGKSKPTKPTKPDNPKFPENKPSKTYKNEYTQKHENNEGPSCAAKPSSEKQTTELKYCTITIQYRYILDHMDNLAPGHEDYISDSGTIINITDYEPEEDETVYDALNKICDENGIKLNATSSVYGVYIVGINNIDEKDCGKSSGWMYKVNGEKPKVSCEKVKISKGDKIEFYFTSL